MQLAASLPHAQLVVIEHAAHAVFFDQPDEFNRKLEQFVVGSKMSRDPGNVKWHLATTALWILRALKTAPRLLE
jgi:hypothetical protein